MVIFDQLILKLVLINHVLQLQSFHMTLNWCAIMIGMTIFVSFWWPHTLNRKFGTMVNICHSAYVHIFRSGKHLYQKNRITYSPTVIILPFFCCSKKIFFRNQEDKFTGETLMHSHSVIILDAKLQQYVRAHITKYDQIFLEGNLYYRSVQLENGMKRICGNINAIHIEKIW